MFFALLRRIGCCLALAIGLALNSGGQAEANFSVAIVHADPAFSAGARDQLFATGLFSNVTLISAVNSTPTLADLTPFSAVLAYTNNVPANAAALGNVLADYVDQGGGLALATYGLSLGFGITGRITTAGYSPLTTVTNGTVSGNLVAVQPADPIFDGVNVNALTYFQNINFARPGLAAGATLLATDGAGINMIARNAATNVIALNLFAGSFQQNVNNPQLYRLFGNSLLSAASSTVVPEPSALLMTGLGLVGSVGWVRHRSRRAC